MNDRAPARTRSGARTRVAPACAALALLLGAAGGALAQSEPAPGGDRLRMSAPDRAVVGDRVEIRVIDGSGTGDLPVTFCVRPPGARVRCTEYRFAPGEARIDPVFRAASPGRWAVEVTSPEGQRLRQAVDAGHANGALRVLATGDSMIQIIDSFLKSRLEERAGLSVRSDAHISTGISKLGMLNWIRYARRQARRRPDVTVMFLGANDGFAMHTRSHGTVQCCGRPWVEEYGRRARLMMSSYARGRAGRVYWLLLPAPRGRDFARVFKGVNAALRLAARRYPDAVRLIDLGRVFTPRGRFRRTIRRGGRTIVARQGDGVHLSVAGASIAASLVIDALRADGVLP